MNQELINSQSELATQDRVSNIQINAFRDNYDSKALNKTLIDVGMGHMKVDVKTSEERRKEGTLHPPTADFNNRQIDMNKNVLIRNVNIANTVNLTAEQTNDETRR